ncbi:flagellar motor switch protein FliM [Vulcanibacillus modesticaldus]|uniref:Flagellar motor switch protein FliM n=1 Tax=Vulcanibacillus modesticaldus TaxID=337097 RepID=A0A1D2YXA6_9BACI|nr:flagellar motor switch protein FliM [Vulcanibacillus modesticaldus]OEG00411.1 flagellar motor switch protein FliM [Vulcanibacillus modesticaldus]
MTEILSQSEIDALLEALTSGEMNAEDLKKDEEIKKVKVYDFKRALRFSKDQIRSLTRIHENFARLLTTYFSAQLRTFVQISVISVDQLPYEEFIRSIPKMTILNIFSAPPLEGRMVLEINPNVAYTMMDRVLGGPGIAPNKISNLTEIEMNIMEKMFTNALDNFKEAWKSIIDVSPRLEAMEMNPQFMQIVSPNETVAVISFNTKIGDTTGMINLCIPHVVLEPVIPKLTAHHWFSQQKKEIGSEDYQYLKNRIQSASLPISVLLGTSNITVSEFLSLSVGDIVQLDNKVGEPLVAIVGNEPKYKVIPGSIKGKLAVQVTDFIEEGAEFCE